MIQMSQNCLENGIPDRFRDTMPESIEFKSIIEKYKDLYFKIVESTISQIDERFSDETLEQILSIAKILKGLADKNEIDNIEALGYYNEMLDFKILKKEFLT